MVGKKLMKIGTIGTGFITDRVMEQLLEYEAYKYEAVCSRHVESAQYLVDKYHVGKVYTDVETMLLDQDIDCIYVASPNALHFKHAKMAMLAGKHVLVEKPFCSNARECEELIRICKETGCFLFEAITTIYTPNYLAIKKELDAISPIKIVQCNMSQYSRKYDAFLEGKKPNVFTLEFSGGALMDLNIYNLHFIVGLFGMPNNVHYDANIQEGIDTSGVLTLNYDTMRVSSVASKETIGNNFCQIQGENGYLLIDGSAGPMKRVELHLRNGERKEISLQNRSAAHYYYGGEFLKMVNENDKAYCYQTLEHSLDVMRVVDMAKASAHLVFDADK